MNPETAAIEQAIADLLTASIEDDARAISTVGEDLVATPFRISDRIPTRAESEIAALVEQPVGAACRQAIRRLGQKLFSVTGSTDGMREIGEHAAARDEQRYGRRIAIVDSAWNGVGSDADRWWS